MVLVHLLVTKGKHRVDLGAHPGVKNLLVAKVISRIDFGLRRRFVSTVAKVRQIESPLFYEGWASYAEFLLIDSGYITHPMDLLVDYKRRLWRSARCQVDVGLTTGKIDGAHAVQQAWVELNVPQCGYCQSGQLMSAASLLEAKADPSDADIDAAMAGNICRCGTYVRIRAAIHRAAEIARAQPETAPEEEGAA